jgi:hypothetical protein
VSEELAAAAGTLLTAIEHDQAEKAGLHSAFDCPVCSGGREHTAAMCVRCYRPKAWGEYCIAHNPARTGKRVLP